MSFISILFNEPTDRTRSLTATQPSFFTDLNLDQVVEAITAGWQDYDLKPFFYFPLSNIDAIHYRQEIFRDLENQKLFQSVNLFAEQMRKVRANIMLKDKLYYHYQKETWFLYAVEIYCAAVKHFTVDLFSANLKSRGLIAFKEYFNGYSNSDYFISLKEEVDALKSDLAKIKYQVLIKDNSFTVQNYETASDYSAEIEKTFEKFQQGAVKDYSVEFKSSPREMNHIEAKILEFVAQLNPDLFSRFENFCNTNVDFIDDVIADFDRDIHFYIAYLKHIEKFKRIKLQFCYPQIISDSKEVFNYEGYDIALAQKLCDTKLPVICNDFYLNGKERIIVVTGPNQGGKTTFARTFGQLHYLAGIGCPVPGSEAQLYLADNIFTQFERVEKVENLRGKLEDDLTRIHSILDNATSQSIIIMNEIFNSTTLQDMTFLSRKVLEKITKLDALCVWVTFVDELSSFNENIVSMTSMIVPENPTLRTFKVIRRPADGLAYAMAIVKKYCLTYEDIKERFRQ